MTGPGEVNLTASASTISTGKISARIRVDKTMSLSRLTTPSAPRKGVSHTEMTGMPQTEVVWPWMRSVKNMSGTK
jgi:hypothetical protein